MTYVSYDATHSTLTCQGKWTIQTLGKILNTLRSIKIPAQLTHLKIDTSQIEVLDLNGALIFSEWLEKLKKQKISLALEGLTPQYEKLLTLVQAQQVSLVDLPEKKTLPWLARIGAKAVSRIQELIIFLNFLGETTVLAIQNYSKFKKLRVRELLSTIELSGYKALPIIALLSFMVGIVLTYQMGLQLRAYGANIFIVDLLGLAILREFGSLLTAIMIAGRTGSAFTAHLGSMVLNQEIDALRTMGIPPLLLLILPRLVGLIIVLPLLTIWSDIFAILGGMLMSKIMLDINFHTFLIRFQEQVTLSSLWIGLGKAPVFALIIASIGCFQGMLVKGGANSLGENTTKSVVQAIFFIIVADAIFSMILSRLGI